MNKKPHHIGPGCYSITPYLVIQNASKAIEFYKNAFGAVELFRMPRPDGSGIAHAEIMIGNSKIMLSDENVKMNAKSPSSIGGSPVMLHLYIEDVDQCMDLASSLGAQIISPAKDYFYGDRSGMLMDPFGHMWSVATHIEDVTEEEINKRYQTLFK